MGAQVVAEGIETIEELCAVIDTGAHFGQGYLLARPTFPPPEPTWPELI
jgi:EAL domain-containing protein (putative c-di-GMP-specific phosphodiesterase class I)